MSLLPNGIGVNGSFYPYTINDSLRFNDNDSAYLSRTPASASNRKTWTWSGWVKRGNLGSQQFLISTSDLSATSLDIRFESGNTLSIGGAGSGRITTSALFRDTSAWYHVVGVYDTTQATSSNRMKLYVNGELQVVTGTYPSLNYDGYLNQAVAHTIGSAIGGGGYLDGYLAEVHFTDGQALDADSFGEFKNGVWVPKAYSGSYGTNGFYLEFDGDVTDSSGNGNDWTANNLASTDYMLDSPTNNFATLNPTKESLPSPLQQGNLRHRAATINSYHLSTHAMSSGKWVFELNIETVGTYSGLGIATKSGGSSDYVGSDAWSWGYNTTGAIRNNTNLLQTVATATSGDVLSCMFDADALEVSFYKNGIQLGTSETVSEGVYFFASTTRISTENVVCVNFGQDSSFAGNKTPQGYTDANGRGDFYYAPPAGALALCTANLPEPVIGPNSDSTSDEHFNTVLYTGNGTSQSITGVGFQPDFNWIKYRSAAGDHALIDVVRGPYILRSSSTIAEFPNNNYQNLTSDGFDVGSSASVNASGGTYVAWNWKANGAGVSNTAGSITSTVSANTDAGFSIVSYTGTGSAATVGHGLNSAPEMVIVKNRDVTASWPVYHVGMTSAAYAMYLDLTNAEGGPLTASWNSTDPTSTVFHLGTSTSSNGSGHNLIAYCFHSVEGFSKFGSYTGNGSADGPFVYCGFRPAFVMVKRTDTTDSWRMYDSVRSPKNADTRVLYPNLSNAEDASTDHFDWLSNGFKCRSTNINASGGTYIFMAFSEMPAKYSLGR